MKFLIVSGTRLKQSDEYVQWMWRRLCVVCKWIRSTCVKFLCECHLHYATDTFSFFNMIDMNRFYLLSCEIDRAALLIKFWNRIAENMLIQEDLMLNNIFRTLAVVYGLSDLFFYSTEPNRRFLLIFFFSSGYFLFEVSHSFFFLYRKVISLVIGVFMSSRNHNDFMIFYSIRPYEHLNQSIIRIDCLVIC